MSELSKSIWIDAPPETVFEYFTNAGKMTQWCGRSAELDPVPKGTYQLDMGEWGVVQGRYVRIEAPTFVSIELHGPEGSDAPPSILEVSITPEAGGSRVDVRQTGLEGPMQLIADRVLDYHLARLSVAANGGSPGSDTICTRTMQG